MASYFLSKTKKKGSKELLVKINSFVQSLGDKIQDLSTGLVLEEENQTTNQNIEEFYQQMFTESTKNHQLILTNLANNKSKETGNITLMDSNISNLEFNLNSSFKNLSELRKYIQKKSPKKIVIFGENDTLATNLANMVLFYFNKKKDQEHAENEQNRENQQKVPNLFCSPREENNFAMYPQIIKFSSKNKSKITISGVSVSKKEYLERVLEENVQNNVKVEDFGCSFTKEKTLNSIFCGSFKDYLEITPLFDSLWKDQEISETTFTSLFDNESFFFQEINKIKDRTSQNTNIDIKLSHVEISIPTLMEEEELEIILIHQRKFSISFSTFSFYCVFIFVEEKNVSGWRKKRWENIVFGSNIYFFAISYPFTYSMEEYWIQELIENPFFLKQTLIGRLCFIGISDNENIEEKDKKKYKIFIDDFFRININEKLLYIDESTKKNFLEKFSQEERDIEILKFQQKTNSLENFTQFFVKIENVIQKVENDQQQKKIEETKPFFILYILNCFQISFYHLLNEIPQVRLITNENQRIVEKRIKNLNKLVSYQPWSLLSKFFFDFEIFQSEISIIIQNYHSSNKNIRFPERVAKIFENRKSIFCFWKQIISNLSINSLVLRKKILEEALFLTIEQKIEMQKYLDEYSMKFLQNFIELNEILNWENFYKSINDIEIDKIGNDINKIFKLELKEIAPQNIEEKLEDQFFLKNLIFNALKKTLQKSSIFQFLLSNISKYFNSLTLFINNFYSSNTIPLNTFVSYRNLVEISENLLLNYKNHKIVDFPFEKENEKTFAPLLCGVSLPPLSTVEEQNNNFDFKLRNDKNEKTNFKFFNFVSYNNNNNDEIEEINNTKKNNFNIIEIYYRDEKHNAMVEVKMIEILENFYQPNVFNIQTNQKETVFVEKEQKEKKKQTKKKKNEETNQILNEKKIFPPIFAFFQRKQEVLKFFEDLENFEENSCFLFIVNCSDQPFNVTKKNNNVFNATGEIKNKIKIPFVEIFFNKQYNFFSLKEKMETIKNFAESLENFFSVSFRCYLWIDLTSGTLVSLKEFIASFKGFKETNLHRLFQYLTNLYTKLEKKKQKIICEWLNKIPTNFHNRTRKQIINRVVTESILNNRIMNQEKLKLLLILSDGFDTNFQIIKSLVSQYDLNNHLLDCGVNLDSVNFEIPPLFVSQNNDSFTFFSNKKNKENKSPFYFFSDNFCSSKISLLNTSLLNFHFISSRDTNNYFSQLFEHQLTPSEFEDDSDNFQYFNSFLFQASLFNFRVFGFSFLIQPNFRSPFHSLQNLLSLGQNQFRFNNKVFPVPLENIFRLPTDMKNDRIVSIFQIKNYFSGQNFISFPHDKDQLFKCLSHLICGKEIFYKKLRRYCKNEMQR